MQTETHQKCIASYLTDADSQLDIDGDGESKPLTDGLLLIRYLFGFSGDSLVSGAIGLMLRVIRLKLLRLTLKSVCLFSRFNRRCLRHAAML